MVLAVCAVLAGARSYAAIAEWAADAGEDTLARLGVAGRVPSQSTIRRVLRRLDADAFEGWQPWASAYGYPLRGVPSGSSTGPGWERGEVRSSCGTLASPSPPAGNGNPGGGGPKKPGPRTSPPGGRELRDKRLPPVVEPPDLEEQVPERAHDLVAPGSHR